MENRLGIGEKSGEKGLDAASTMCLCRVGIFKIMCRKIDEADNIHLIWPLSVYIYHIHWVFSKPPLLYAILLLQACEKKSYLKNYNST